MPSSPREAVRKDVDLQIACAGLKFEITCLLDIFSEVRRGDKTRDDLETAVRIDVIKSRIREQCTALVALLPELHE